MNIVELNNLVRKISLSCPLVNSYYNMSPYECWNTKEVKYGSVVMDVTNVSTNTATSTYQCLFYYGDRLTESKTNKNSVRTDAITILDSIISKLYEQEGISITYNQSYTLFEQKFEDELAGAYVTVDVQVMGDGMCGFDVEIGSYFEVVQLHETIKENGLYEWKSGKDKYYDQVVLDVDVPKGLDVDFSVIYDENTINTITSKMNEDIVYTKSLEEQWKSSNNVSTYRTYYNDRNIVYGPDIDLNKSSDTSCRQMFYGCDQLRYIPQYDMSNKTGVEEMFYTAYNLIEIPLLDFSNVKYLSSLFGYSNNYYGLKTLGGFKNVGKSFTSTSSLTNQILDISLLYNLTHESLMNVINNLYDLNLNGKWGRLTLGTINISKLTSDEIAIATNKGWIVS